MNIIAIMGPHRVFYKDEPVRELDVALTRQGFHTVYPQGAGDLLKLVEHNPRICGVVFDWDEYSLDLCREINQLNEYLPLYAFINTDSTMDVGVNEMRMAIWFLSMRSMQVKRLPSASANIPMNTSIPSRRR